VSYKLALALLRGGGAYHGHVVITFYLTSKPSDSIFVDYKGSKVIKLVINGDDVIEGEPFRNHRIYFPKELLKEGRNEVAIRFESSYVRDCQGL
jgi:hypothetical protein